jgi:hypothetical protein
MTDGSHGHCLCDRGFFSSATWATGRKKAGRAERSPRRVRVFSLTPILTVSYPMAMSEPRRSLLLGPRIRIRSAAPQEPQTARTAVCATPARYCRFSIVDFGLSIGFPKQRRAALCANPRSWVIDWFLSPSPGTSWCPPAPCSAASSETPSTRLRAFRDGYLPPVRGATTRRRFTVRKKIRSEVRSRCTRDTNRYYHQDGPGTHDTNTVSWLPATHLAADPPSLAAFGRKSPLPSSAHAGCQPARGSRYLEQEPLALEGSRKGSPMLDQIHTRVRTHRISASTSDRSGVPEVSPSSPVTQPSRPQTDPSQPPS